VVSERLALQEAVPQESLLEELSSELSLSEELSSSSTIRMCDLRLAKLQQELSFKSYDSLIVQFVVHACMWSIVAIRAFRDPDSCDFSTIDGFPPEQKPTLHTTVLNRLIEALDTPTGAEILSSPTAEITAEQEAQLVEHMHGVVKKLA